MMARHRRFIQALALVLAFAAMLLGRMVPHHCGPAIAHDHSMEHGAAVTSDCAACDFITSIFTAPVAFEPLCCTDHPRPMAAIRQVEVSPVDLELSRPRGPPEA